MTDSLRKPRKLKPSKFRVGQIVIGEGGAVLKVVSKRFTDNSWRYELVEVDHYFYWEDELEKLA